MKKRILAFLLAVVMTVGLLPMSALAAERSDTTDQVRVIVENNTYSAGPWTGTLVDTWVTLTDTSTAASCVEAALTEKGYTQSGAESNYISEINGLTAGSAGGYDGWMVMINDWFTAEGIGAYAAADGTLEDGDEIKMVYSMSMGEDVGGSWSNNNKTLAELSFSEGTLSPAFSSATKAYTLTVPEETDSVVITPTAANKNFQVRTNVGEAEYKRSDAIPVEDGSVITVTCGDPTWPSMNNGEYGSGAEDIQAEVYTITVSVEGGDEVATDPCSLTALEIAVGGSTIESAKTQTLTPVFAGDTTGYVTQTLDYISSSGSRYVWIKASAPEGAEISAECGNSGVTAMTNGEWTVLQTYAGMSWGVAYYTGPLSTGSYNKVAVTVSADGESKEYVVTIPVQPDIANSGLVWKTDLSDGIYYTQNTEDAVLTVEAQYKNRPLENKNEITYQWYTNTTASNKGGTPIQGAISPSFALDTKSLGTTYYYVVAACEGLDSISSKAIAVTVANDSAPTSITVVCEHPYTIPYDWDKALGGVSYVAKVGDTMTLKALDENGKETPVAWPASLGGGTLDKTIGTSCTYTVTNTSYSYIQVSSLYDSSIQSEEKIIEVKDYAISEYYKAPSVTLSEDGQKAAEISARGGLSGYNIWTYQASGDGIAELVSDLATKSNWLKFTALRPGTIHVSFDLDLNGDGKADNNGQTDSAILSINGIAVEDAAGKVTKTYMEHGKTVQLKALSSSEDADFTWSSADETIAAVDQNGLVTAKGVGSVIISAKDGTYTGGIKVVVTSPETPCFEQIDFTTTNTWGTGLSNATWKTANFKAATLSYTGLAMTKAAAGSLILQDTTLYDAEQYTAEASYTDANGKAQTITVSSGKETTLPDLPFGTNIVTITLTDKTDSTKKTSYTFEITRPRDTVKTIASNGIVFLPDGREVLKDKYNEKSEGTMYVANEDGSFAQYQGVNSSRLYYRTYALNGLEAFSLTAKGSSAYTHIRCSVDDGTTWTYLGQTGTSGVSTGKITIPLPSNQENAVVKVMLQILDDQTYAANVAAGKDGFADSQPNTYTLWVEQIPALGSEASLLSASTDKGDWYPAFAESRTSYRIVVAPDAEAPTLTYTASRGAVVTIDGEEQTPNDAGEYTLTLTESSQAIQVTSEDGLTSRTYSFGYSQRESAAMPDRVVDFLCINSQYVNGANNGYGVSPQKVITGGDVLSLGNFGGYVTFYYEDGLTNDPKHAYGVDFYIDGNALKDTTNASGLGFMEPGQVWVSENGTAWYALAGSAHYEDSTLWDYSVTYTKTETGGTAWSDNLGNTHANTHGRTFTWPSQEIYTMNDLSQQDSFTLSGILLPCADGTPAGKDSAASTPNGIHFGYVDALVNGRANPYLENTKYTNQSSGFDLAWAVDSDGQPVDVNGKEFHYVKVVTATNLMAGGFNEKSTEVGSVERATAQSNAVGITEAPTGVTISDGAESKTIFFAEDQQVYEVDLDDMKYVSITVNGTASEDNIYINNQRVSSGNAAQGFKVTKETGEKLVRILVQNGEKEPVIYLLKLTSGASNSNDLLEGVKVNVSGTSRVAETKDGKTYTLDVGYRIDTIGVVPVADTDVSLTINGKPLANSYALTEGANTFTIKATKGSIAQTATLTVTKAAAPEATGTITVYFTLLGDSEHGSNNTVHTLATGGLTTWIPRTTYTVENTCTVLDVLDKALAAANISYVNEGGNYIATIKGLSEFDNGPLSGWMYTLNGSHPDLGVAEQSLKNGDRIIFHYTDDYTQEESFSEDFTGGGTQVPPEEETPSATLSPEGTVNSKGEATVKVEPDAVKDGLAQVEKDQADALVIAPAIKGEANSVTTQLPFDAAEAITENGKIDLAIQTDTAQVTIPNETLDAIVTQSSGKETIEVVVTLCVPDAFKDHAPQADMKNAVAVEVTVYSGSKAITSFGGNKLTIDLPVNKSVYKSDTNYRVLVLSSDGTSEFLTGRCMQKGNDFVVRVSTTHLSTFVVLPQEVHPYTDVTGHWAEDAIAFVYEKGLMTGTKEDAFSPETELSRAMLVTILYRMAGEPAVTADNTFSDVAGDTWYTNAVIWASQNGIVNGVGQDRFAPNQDITREQMAAMLLRYSDYKGYDTTQKNDLADYTDADQISTWALEALQWANGEGLITGRKADLLVPQGDTTRAETATILMRYLETIA